MLTKGNDRLKTVLHIMFLTALCFWTSRVAAQNFNYLDSGDEFEIETSSAMNNEQEIISNLVILMDFDMYNRNYRAMLRSLDRLAKIYSPDSLALLTRKLELFENQHPFHELCEKKKSGDSSYALWQPFKSRQFKLYFAEQVQLLKNYERLSHGAHAVAAKIYQSSTAYLTNHAYAEAQYLLNWLKKDYADTYYVKRNFVDNRLKSIMLDVGAELPAMKLASFTGKEIHIASRDDVPTLIAYLDPYSNDYKSDLHNTIQVSERIKNIQIVVLLNSTIQKNELSHLVPATTIQPVWAPANEETKKELGLSDYSSNMLASSENKIIAKDMNFSTLPEDVAFFLQRQQRACQAIKTPAAGGGPITCFHCVHLSEFQY